MTKQVRSLPRTVRSKEKTCNWDKDRRSLSFPTPINGKTLRHFYDTGADKGAIHMVSNRDYAPLSNPQGR